MDRRPRRISRKPAKLRDDAASTSSRSKTPSDSEAARKRRAGSPASSTSTSSSNTQAPPQPQVSGKKKKKTASKKPGKVGKQPAFTETVLLALRENAEERKKHIDDLVDGLSEAQAKDLLKSLAREQPGIVLNIMDMYEAPAPAGPVRPAPPHHQPHWCTCGNCRLMHSAIEEVCCRQQPDNCLSRTPEMQHLCLDQHVLHLSMLYRADILAIRNIGQNNDREKNKSFRYSGYRQHTLWQHGRLGIGVRRVIPSCCVWKIRDTYPDPSGQYVPFRPGHVL